MKQVPDTTEVKIDPETNTLVREGVDLILCGKQAIDGDTAQVGPGIAARLNTYICPAKVYSWSEEENLILTAYEGCVECGTCRYACPPHVIDWRNPRGGFGIQYKFG